jgi:hypothetical protein
MIMIKIIENKNRRVDESKFAAFHEFAPKSFHPTIRAVPLFFVESVKVDWVRLMTGHMLSHTAGSQMPFSSALSLHVGQP